MEYVADPLAGVNTHVYGGSMDSRLTKFDWIEQGLRTLSDEGVGAVKVGPMATKLNVSRGSFYWHFRDIADFRSQLLRSWQERTTDMVIQQIAATAEPDRLKSLMMRAFNVNSRLDRAIRSWAAEDADVAGIVASVDVNRVDYIAHLLVAAGVESQRAAHRAAFLYWAYLGQMIAMNPHHSSITASTVDDIANLFEQ